VRSWGDRASVQLDHEVVRQDPRRHRQPLGSATSALERCPQGGGSAVRPCRSKNRATGAPDGSIEEVPSSSVEFALTARYGRAGTPPAPTRSSSASERTSASPTQLTSSLRTATKLQEHSRCDKKLVQANGGVAELRTVVNAQASPRMLRGNGLLWRTDLQHLCCPRNKAGHWPHSPIPGQDPDGNTVPESAADAARWTAMAPERRTWQM